MPLPEKHRRIVTAENCLSLGFVLREWRGRSRAFWALTALLLLTRVGALPWIADIMPVGDEGPYIRGGRALLTIISQWLTGIPPDPEALRHFYHFGLHPPLASVMAGVPYEMGGMAAARGLQALIGIVGGLYFFRLAGLVLPRGGAIVAYGAYVLNPYLIAFSHFLWVENVYLLLGSVWLIWYFQTVAEGSGRWTGVVTGACLTGLLWYAKSAFTPVWLALLLAAPLIARRRGPALRTYVVAGTIGFVLALPWDLVILSQEGRFLHGSTAAAVHVAAKYNDRGLETWLETWDYTHQRAAIEGGHFIDHAKKIAAEYFASLEGDPRPPLKIVARDTLERYLLGRSFIERHLAWGIYPSGVPALGVGLLVYDHVVRVLLIVFGGLGLLLGRLSAAARWTLVALALAHAAIVVVGMPNGRHILMNYPVLTLGLGALWEQIRRSRAQLAAATAAALIVVIVALADFGRRTSAWPYRFLEPLAAAGAKPRQASDLIQLRSRPRCGPAVTIELESTAPASITVQTPGDQARREAPDGLRLTVLMPWLQLRVEQPAAGATRYLTLRTDDGRRYRVDLLRQSGTWTPIDGSCLLARWRGNRPR